MRAIKGRSFSTAIGLSKDGKWVFIKASLTPWCHVVVQFEVKMSHFFNQIHEKHKDPARS